MSGGVHLTPNLVDYHRPHYLLGCYLALSDPFAAATSGCPSRVELSFATHGYCPAVTRWSRFGPAGPLVGSFLTRPSKLSYYFANGISGSQPQAQAPDLGLSFAVLNFMPP
jgi:hypothetical protein